MARANCFLEPLPNLVEVKAARACCRVAPEIAGSRASQVILVLGADYLAHRFGHLGKISARSGRELIILTWPLAVRRSHRIPPPRLVRIHSVVCL
jgi:hypothetical protein